MQHPLQDPPLLIRHLVDAIFINAQIRSCVSQNITSWNSHDCHRSVEGCWKQGDFLLFQVMERVTEYF